MKHLMLALVAVVVVFSSPAFAASCPVKAYGQIVGCPLPANTPSAVWDTHEYGTRSAPYSGWTNYNTVGSGSV